MLAFLKFDVKMSTLELGCNGLGSYRLLLNRLQNSAVNSNNDRVYLKLNIYWYSNRSLRCYNPQLSSIKILDFGRIMKYLCFHITLLILLISGICSDALYFLVKVTLSFTIVKFTQLFL